MKNNKKSHVKLGDNVKIISGKQRGIIGKIKLIFRQKSLVVVEGVPTRIKYSKNKQKGEAKKIELPITIHSSNIMLWDSQANQSSRIGYKFLNNQKTRYFKKSGNFL